MTDPVSRADRLARLERDIASAREGQEQPLPTGAAKYAALSLAWRLLLELVVGVMIGALMGWGLDRLLGTLPLFLIVLGLLGFVAGVRVMLRTADAASKRDDAGPRAGGAGADGGA